MVLSYTIVTASSVDLLLAAGSLLGLGVAMADMRLASVHVLLEAREFLEAPAGVAHAARIRFWGPRASSTALPIFSDGNAAQCVRNFNSIRPA